MRCVFEAAGWTCGSTGFLWFDEEERPDTTDFPCPQCNTINFLKSALRKARGNKRMLSICSCCGTDMTNAALRAAVETARDVSPLTADKYLASIGDEVRRLAGRIEDVRTIECSSAQSE
jgi:transcription elongation factor Elf1